MHDTGKSCTVILLIAIGLVRANLDFLTYYETTNTLVTKDLDPARRLRRSLDPQRKAIVARSLSFHGFNQEFNVILDSRHLFADDLKLSVHEFKNRPPVTTPLLTGRYYQGHLEGDPDSWVHGRLLGDNVFDGVINSHKLKNTFYVEPATKFPQIKTNSSHIIYRFTDLNISKYPRIREKAQGRNLPNYYRYTNHYTRPSPSSLNNRTQRLRSKRRVRQNELRSMHCTIHLVIDHRFYERIGKQSIAGTIDEAIYHMGQADSIFRSTDFDGSGTASNIGFIIAKITVFKTAATNPMSSVGDGADAEEYLTVFGDINNEDFCLGIAFTVVDFRDGVLGLAWIADPARVDSGICSPPYLFPNGTRRFFNTGIISHINYGRLIPRAMFSITVAHEIGHDFGAEHDSTDRYTCAPGGADGNYLMFHLSGDGLKPNHFLFSSCSINYIYKTLIDRIDICFEEKYLTFCSNAIVDKDTEQCDCGTEQTCEGLDPCCNVYIEEDENNCKLRTEAKCSAMSSRCCSPDTCDFVPATERQVCSPSSECTEIAYCDGTSSGCPTPEKLDDGTLCYGNQKVCVNGICAKTVCQYHGFVDCYCTTTEDDCRVCCQRNTSTTCKPATSFGFRAGEDGSIPVNGLCRDGRGICDTGGICVFLDGTFAKADLNRLVQESANEAFQVLANYWYYALLAVAAICLLVGLFIFMHKRNKPVQSMAYKDGRMAYVWFEARLRLEQIEAELEELANFDETAFRSLPFPIAARRIAFQFPTVPVSLYTKYLMQCETEADVVKLLLISGYPMRKLITEDKAAADSLEAEDIQKALDSDLEHDKDD